MRAKETTPPNKKQEDDTQTQKKGRTMADEDRIERPIRVHFHNDKNYGTWLMVYQPQLLTEILTPANGFLTPSNVRKEFLSIDGLPSLPQVIRRRIWKESNDMLVKEKQDYCQAFNQNYDLEETIMRGALTVPIPDGRCYGLYQQTIRFVKYTMDGGQVWQDDCLLGNCQRCFAVGPLLYHCRETKCRFGGGDTRFHLIRFIYESMGREDLTNFVHPYIMARFAGKYFGMFNFRPLPPPLNKQDPGSGLSLSRQDALGSIVNWRAEDFLEHCYQMNLSTNQGEIRESGPYPWSAPAFMWTNLPDNVYELFIRTRGAVEEH